MNDDFLLDEDEIQQEGEWKWQRLIPLFVMVLGTIAQLFWGYFYWPGFAWSIFWLLLCGILIAGHLRRGIFLLGCLSLAAGLNLVDFLPFELTLPLLTFRFNDIAYWVFGIDFVSLLLFPGLFALVNEDLFLEEWKTLFKHRAPRRALKKLSEVERFKSRYAAKPTTQLEQLASNESLRPEAQQAAQELLKERKIA